MYSAFIKDLEGGIFLTAKAQRFYAKGAKLFLIKSSHFTHKEFEFVKKALFVFTNQTWNTAI